MSAMYDEEVSIDNADEVDSSISPKTPQRPFVSSRMEMRAEMKPKRERPMSAAKFRTSSRIQQTPVPPSRYEHGDSEASDNTDDDDDDDEDDQAAILEGGYDPKDFENLPVSSEIKDLFQYITFYTPLTVQLEYKLAPFVPEYIPSVGDIDGFLKVRRPDGIDDKLGLVVLDEPATIQSEPAVMHLQLRAATKQTSAKPVVVKKLENPEKNPKAIEKWIRDIGDLHKTKPPPTLEYSRPMPDIDGLMQEWPPDFENKLNDVGLPLEDLEVDLLTYVDIICAIFDIPRYESRIESLHVLFTLYSAIKNYKTNNENSNTFDGAEN